VKNEIGYREEENGVVVLRMTRDDYNALLVALGFATGAAPRKDTRDTLLGLVNRLNAGNPSYTPYEIATRIGGTW
jgi:hypothetical protein